jgi:serine/threonine protein phosphatase PrpC
MNENYFGLSDTGKMRDNNEDAFIAERILKDRYIMACVIDGVGGYEGGEIAAHIAREYILSYFSIPSGEMITMMREAMMLANEKIYEERLKEAQNQSMACVLTMAVADIENHKFYYAHIGDTRLYLFRDNSLVKITKDHSFVGFLEDTGRLTEEEAMNHPKRNEINKALGFDAQMRSSAEYIETGESPFLPGDILLLCSDGLSDMVSNKEITSILINNKTLAEKCKSLVEAANNSGGRTI